METRGLMIEWTKRCCTIDLEMERRDGEGGGGIVLRPVAPPNIPALYIAMSSNIQADEIEWM